MAPVTLGLLITFSALDAISVFQNFYYNQRKSVLEFLPGWGFLFAMVSFTLIGSILQIILYKFLFRLNNFLRFFIAIVFIGIIILLIIFFSSELFYGEFVSACFVGYSLINYFVYKAISTHEWSKFSAT